MLKQSYGFGVLAIVTCLVTPVTVSTQLLDPNDPISPKDISACHELGMEWMHRIDYLIEQSQQCAKDVRDHCRFLGSISGPATESSCLKERTNPRWQNSMDYALYTECQGDHDRYKQAMRDADAAKARCSAKVSDAEKERQEEDRRKEQAKQDEDRRKESARQTDRQDATNRSGSREDARDKTNDSDKRASSSSSSKLGDSRDDLRRMRDEAIKAQMKADERALEMAAKASQQEQEALTQRTAERDAEKARIEAGIGVIDARYAAEAGQLTDYQSGLVARLFDSAVNNTVASATAGGSGAADFDFDARIESLDTQSNALSIVGSVIAPFASLPLSITNWILKENLKTFDDLSNTLVNFDRTTPADVERVWQDYHARVWAPEQWISKIAIETATGWGASQITERAVKPTFELVAERTGRVISNRSLREIFRPMPEQEPITWRWFSGSSTRVDGSLRTDTSGMPLLRDFTDKLYRYDAVANRADYTRNELEMLVASGDFTLVRQPVAKWKWELNHVTFYPGRAQSAEEHGLEWLSPWNGLRGDPKDIFLYTPIEASIGIGLNQLLDDASDPQEAQEKLAGWIRDAVQRLETDNGGAR